MQNDPNEVIQTLEVETALGTLIVSVEDIHTAGGLAQWWPESGYQTQEEPGLPSFAPGEDMTRQQYQDLPELC
jgi:hypothetical protein